RSPVRDSGWRGRHRRQRCSRPDRNPESVLWRGWESSLQKSRKKRRPNYNESMARLPATSPRSSRTARNGTPALQARLSGLRREARWIVFAALAAWLGLVLATWNPADPAWSHSVHATTTLNRGGTLGAYISDFLLFLFGYSAWLWVVLLAQRVVQGFYRLTHI